MNKRIFRICLLAAILLAAVSVQGADLIIVVNSQVTENELNINSIRDIFLGKKTTWQNGIKIIPVIINDEIIHPAFLKEYLNKTPSNFSAYWNQILFTGKGIPPRIFENEKELMRYVSITRGTIGYISAKANIGDAKVVKVINK